MPEHGHPAKESIRLFAESRRQFGRPEIIGVDAVMTDYPEQMARLIAKLEGLSGLA